MNLDANQVGMIASRSFRFSLLATAAYTILLTTVFCKAQLMKQFIYILFAVPILFSCINADAQTTADKIQILKLWPSGIPADATPLSPEAIDAAKQRTTKDRIFFVNSPELSVFEPAEKRNGTAVVVCPGGGYNMLAHQHEGVELAEWFNSIGVTAFVLKYRVPRRNAKRIHWEPMQDVQRAMRIVRSKANEFKIDPERIGVLGFSAGGHLTVMAGTQFETDSYPAVDEADELSCRPNFICPIYAAYLADGYKDNVVELGNLVKVTEKTPPTFLAVTWDDTMRGAQSALLFAELKKKGVPAELHIWQKGGHGYGIRKRGNASDGWEDDLKIWLKLNGMLPE